MKATQKTAAQFWEDATPRLVRKLYADAGMVFHEACLFNVPEFAFLDLRLKVAIYESDEFRFQVNDPTLLTEEREFSAYLRNNGRAGR
jgi:hypothetical protein